MGTDPIIKQGETATNVNMGADNPQVNTGHHSGSTAQPIPILGQSPAQQSPQMAASHEQAPNTMGDYTSRIVKDKGDYFSHDKKGYYRKDGKTYLITGAPEGDVELDADQTAQLDQSRTAKAGQDQKVKDAMANQEIITEGFANQPVDDSYDGGSLVAEGGVLKHYDAQGNLLGEYPYTSGVDGVTDPSQKDRGPLPQGGYTAKSSQISEVRGLRYIARNIVGDWGTYRVPLTPDPGTNTYERDGFFIHGGKKPGSKGCLDVGGNEESLFPAIRKQGGTVRLTVK